MLASCLSLEFTRAGRGPFTAIMLRSSHSARVAVRVRLLVFISAPFPVLPLVSIG